MMIMRSMVVHTARISIRGQASLVYYPITPRHTIDGVPLKILWRTTSGSVKIIILSHKSIVNK